MIFEGIVENNIDEMKLSRVQVRIFGIHTENRDDEEAEQYMPVEDLPWAEVGLPVFGGMEGAGINGVLERGTPVYIMFKDEEQQKPLVIAVKQQIMKDAPDSGFSDPENEYPSDEMRDKVNGGSGANMQYRDSFKEEKDDISDLGEPKVYGNSNATQNKVIQSKHHIIELDDTDGEERVHIYHKSGSFQEYHADGGMVERTKLDRYTIVLGDWKILVEGDVELAVKGNVNSIIEGNMDSLVEGDSESIINGNSTSTVNGDLIINPTGNVFMESDGELNISFNGDANIDIGGNLTANVDGDADVSIGGNSIVAVDGDASLSVGGNAVWDIEGDFTHTVNGDFTYSINGTYSMNINSDMVLNSSGSAVFSGNGVAIDGFGAGGRGATEGAAHGSTIGSGISPAPIVPVSGSVKISI